MVWNRLPVVPPPAIVPVSQVSSRGISDTSSRRAYDTMPPLIEESVTAFALFERSARNCEPVVTSSLLSACAAVVANARSTRVSVVRMSGLLVEEVHGEEAGERQ